MKNFISRMVFISLMILVNIFIGESEIFAQGHSVFGCNSCHVTHTADGTQLTTVAGNALLCQSCHKNPGVAQTLPLPDAIIAVPGVSGTSHAWNRAAINFTYGAVLPTNTEMSIRVMSGDIVCSTCHNQHNDNVIPNYLRMDNTGDAMCKDCHSVRNVGIYSADPANNKGSHPVGLVYNTADSRLLAVSAGSVTLPAGKIECSSCHGIHGLSETTTSDGYILRQTNDNILCTSCHTYGSHNGNGCKTCHQSHNTDKTNILMVRNSVVTPVSGTKNVVFTAESGTNSFADADATYNGICEVCHTLTTYHKNDGTGSGHNNATNCAQCHLHSANFAAPDCDNCHINTTDYEIDAHSKHVTGLYTYSCNTCHLNYGFGGSLEPVHPSGGAANVNFDPNGLATRNGLDSNTPTWSGTNCSNIYCHSDGRTAYRGTDGTYTWSGTTGPQTATYTSPIWDTDKITLCTSCHRGVGNMTSPYKITSPFVNASPPATGSHLRGAHVSNSKDFSSYGWASVQCFWCHNADGASANGPNFQGTYGTNFHVDGQTRFDPRSFSAGGTFADGMSFSYDGSSAHCGNGKTCW